MSKCLFFFTGFISTLLCCVALQASDNPQVPQQSESHPKSYPFTGKIIGSHVRMRTRPDLESCIVRELVKGDYVLITGEKGDFYTVQAPNDLKSYIFRGFVVDNTVQGERVNVRIAPNREAPVIAHYNMGDAVEGSISETDTMWLEINTPEHAHFYIAKEFVEYGGNSNLKVVYDKKKESVDQLARSTDLLAEAEMQKPFIEIDIDRIVQNYQTIINDYADFTQYANAAAKKLIKLKEKYLERKVAHLETKATHPTTTPETMHTTTPSQNNPSPTDRMKIWESIERSLYLTWASTHHIKTIDEFYEEQTLNATTIAGVLEHYAEPVKNKPGDFILKDRDIPIAYVYSTEINLEELVGKRVNLLVAPRPNNDFAFPAYYALDAK